MSHSQEWYIQITYIKKFNYIRALEIFCNHIYISADSSSTPTTSSETDLKINLKLTLHSQIKEFQCKFFSKCKLFQWKKSRWIKHLFVNVWYSHLSVFTPTRHRMATNLWGLPETCRENECTGKQISSLTTHNWFLIWAVYIHTHIHTHTYW